jgi:hypothetical protein
MQDLTLIITSIICGLLNWLILFLQSIDPSLLQNVILGMLALLVPVGVGVLSFFFSERAKGNLASNLELYILLKTVLKADKIVIFSFVSLFLLSLYNINYIYKILGFSFFLFYIIWILSNPFKNIWKWFLENTKDFSIIFLKSLSVRGNKNTILSSWQALWLGTGEKQNELDFTKIFISHVDEALKHGDLELALELSQIYVSNIEKRERISIGYEILPKVLEWNEILWNKQQFWNKRFDSRRQSDESFLEKNLPTFSALLSRLYKKTKSEREYFWNWHYFGGEFFTIITKILLKDGHGSYQLFTEFEKHIKNSIKKLNEIENQEENKKYDQHISGLVASFCPTFFNHIDSAPAKHEIWEHNFPSEWKISASNIGSGIAHVILNEFVKWSSNRVYKDNSSDIVDKDLSEVIMGIFPNIDPSLFTAFLLLFSTHEVKSALEKEPNFYITNGVFTWSGSVNESKEDTDRRLSEMMSASAKSQKEETIQVLLKFFPRYWDFLRLTLTDDNKKTWENADTDEQLKMVKIARKQKLEKLRKEIESEEIISACKNIESKEQRRKDFLRLITLLLLE